MRKKKAEGESQIRNEGMNGWRVKGHTTENDERSTQFYTNKMRLYGKREGTLLWSNIRITSNKAGKVEGSGSKTIFPNERKLPKSI